MMMRTQRLSRASATARRAPAASSFTRGLACNVGASPCRLWQSSRAPTRRTQAGAEPEGRSGAGEHEAKPKPVDAPPPQQRPKSPDEQAEDVLEGLWITFKAELKNSKSLSPEEAKMLDGMDVDGLMDLDAVATTLANQYVGPVLAAAGIRQDPKDFFFDFIKLAIALQLITCGAAYYAAEFGAHLDTGEALRCSLGLALGYLTRPLFNVERLLWPLYTAGLSLITQTSRVELVYEVEPASGAEMQEVLNRLGVTLACGLFIPQLLWGWHTQESVQLMGPVAAGWACFDLAFMVALAAKLSWTAQEEE